MAKPPAVIVPAAPPVFIVGLVKHGPQKYSVVTGTMEKPVHDTAQQPLDYAMEAMRIALQHLARNCP